MQAFDQARSRNCLGSQPRDEEFCGQDRHRQVVILGTGGWRRQRSIRRIRMRGKPPVTVLVSAAFVKCSRSNLLRVPT